MKALAYGFIHHSNCRAMYLLGAKMLMECGQFYNKHVRAAPTEFQRSMPFFV